MEKESKLRILPVSEPEVDEGARPSGSGTVTVDLRRVSALAVKITDACLGYNSAEVALAMKASVSFTAAQQAVNDFLEGIACQTQVKH